MFQDTVPSASKRRNSSVRGGGGRKLGAGKNGTKKTKGKEKSGSKGKRGSSSSSSSKGKEPTPADRTIDADNIFDHSPSTVSTEEGFVAFCQSNLLSYGRASDGLVSQNDAAGFLSETCTVFGDTALPELNCPSPQFANLDLEIRLNFVSYICSGRNTLSCLADLGVQQAEFGYPITEDTAEQSIEYVRGFCCSLLPFLDPAGLEPLGQDSSVCPAEPVSNTSQDNLAGNQVPVLSTSPGTGLPSGVSPTLQPIELPVLAERGINSQETQSTLSVAGTISITLVLSVLMLLLCCFLGGRKKSGMR